MLTNDLTPSRTFDEKGTERNIILNFDTDNAPIFTQPNPFSTETTLNFTLNTEGVMQYIIFDETGKKIYQKYEFFKSGTNFLRLDSAATGMLESGFYIFQLETPDGVKTIKLHKI